MAKYLALIATLFIIGSLSLELKASCCSGASATGIGRLKRHERAYIAFINDAHRVMGSFDRNARFGWGQPRHLPSWRFNHELQAMARLTSFFEPFIKLPARTQKSAERTGHNIADITFGLHMPLLDEEYWHHWPALSFIASLTIPSGVAAGDSNTYAAESITSMGHYDLAIAAMAQKSLGNIVLALGYGMTFAPALFTRQSYYGGTAHAPSLSLSFSPHEKAQMQANFSPTFYSAATINRRPLADSSRRELLLSLAYSLMLHSHLALNTSIGTHIPISFIGKNSFADAYAQVGIRIGVF